MHLIFKIILKTPISAQVANPMDMLKFGLAKKRVKHEWKHVDDDAMNKAFQNKVSAISLSIEFRSKSKSNIILSGHQ